MANNAGFDMGTLTPVVLNRFLDDHKADLGTYMVDRVCRPEPVDDPAGVFERWETPVEMASEEGTSSKHAAGTSTPKGNAALGTRSYLIDSYSIAYPINHLAKKSLEARKNQFKRLAGKGGHQVQKDKDKDLARILKGLGAADRGQDLTVKQVTNAWDTANGTPITDIDDVILALRGADNGLICIAGWDVMLDLTRNPEVVNHADKEFVSIQDVIDTLMERGISEFFIDYNPSNANSANQPRQYRGILDGVFSIQTRGNLVKPYMNPLSMDAYEDKDTRIQNLRASEDCTITTEYAEHGYAFTSIQT